MLFKGVCSECGKEFVLHFKPNSNRHYRCHKCWEVKNENEPVGKWESQMWTRKMGILDGALGVPNNQARKSYTYKYFYERSRKKHFSEAYIVGLIGEREARKWLEENGYQVYEFSMICHIYFGGLSDNISEIRKTHEIMRRRRKQDNIEIDKQLIDDYKQGVIAGVNFLKEMFGKDYISFRRFFAALDKIKRTVGKGERYPDFLVKKQDIYSLVEVKANKSKMLPGQIQCFTIAQRYGLATKILRVKLEESKVREIQLVDQT